MRKKTRREITFYNHIDDSFEAYQVLCWLGDARDGARFEEFKNGVLRKYGADSAYVKRCIALDEIVPVLKALGDKSKAEIVLYIKNYLRMRECYLNRGNQVMKVNGYLYETHMHTKESSACAHNTGAEMARAYKEAGYTGIIITDHFFYGNTAIDRSLPWRDWVEQFCKGYEHAKAEGDKIGLQVFFGWESGYRGTEFLVYGLDKEWLLAHPEIVDATIEEQYTLVHEGGGIVSHAHPFREEDYIAEIRLFPEYVDAVEGVNAMHSSDVSNSHKNPLFNERAMEYGRQHGLPFTAGSDQHTTFMIGGGMVFPRKLADIHDFTQAVVNRETLKLLDGTAQGITFN